jgi:hypothetical protein
VQQRPATGPLSPQPATASDAVRVQILATEHWSLLATRQLAWTEAYSRTGIFLTVLSASVVALALVRQAGSEGDFTLFALVLLPVVLFLGLATYARLGTVNQEEGRLLIGMNRLRRGYLDIAPDLEPYFTTGVHDDLRGLAQTAGMDVPRPSRFPLQVLVSTPGVVGVIDCVIAGVLCALVGRAASLSNLLSILVGVLGALLLLVVLIVLPLRAVNRWVRGHAPRFPSGQLS